MFKPSSGLYKRWQKLLSIIALIGITLLFATGGLYLTHVDYKKKYQHVHFECLISKADSIGEFQGQKTAMFDPGNSEIAEKQCKKEHPKDWRYEPDAHWITGMPGTILTVFGLFFLSTSALLRWLWKG